jgi:hypothetical protein
MREDASDEARSTGEADAARRITIPDPAHGRERLREIYEQRHRGGWGHMDGRKLEGHIETLTVDSTAWHRVIDVKGRGRLTALGVAGGPCYHEFKVEIDHRVVVADTLAGSGLPAHVNNGLAVDLPFEERLRVEARDQPNRSALAKYWVCWVTEQAQLVEETTTVEQVDGVDYRLSTRRYMRDDETVTTVEASLGPRLVSEVWLMRDWVQVEWGEDGPYARLEGSVVIRDLADEGGDEVLGEAPAIVRLAGRSAPVGELTLASGDERASYLPAPGPGEYSIAATLSGRSNRPTYFTVLPTFLTML